MFLDSGNVTSDHTINAQCQDCGGKVPEVSAESLCLCQGMATIVVVIILLLLLLRVTERL